MIADDIYASEILEEHHEWTGTISVPAKVVDGNKHSKELEAEVTLQRTSWKGTRLHEILDVEASYEYCDDKGEVTDRDGDIKLKFRHYSDHSWYWLVSEKIEFDDIDELTFRSEALVGLGYIICYSEHFAFDIWMGIGHVDAFYDDGTEDERYYSLPWGWDFSWQIWRELVLSNSMEVLPSLEDLDVYVYTNTSALTYPFAKCWLWELEYEIEYNSTPAQDKKTSDKTLELKLVYTF